LSVSTWIRYAPLLPFSTRQRTITPGVDAVVETPPRAVCTYRQEGRQAAGGVERSPCRALPKSEPEQAEVAIGEPGQRSCDASP
jgi:hypothetical protein